MSAFRPSGSGGGIDPAQLAALVDDSEAAGLAAAIVGAIESAGLPPGYVGEFPADAVPAGYTVVQGLPADLPSGIGTVSSARTTGSNGNHRGFATTTQRLWSLYNSVLQALDVTTNRYETLTYTLPFSAAAGTMLHDMVDNAMLVTAGSAGSLGSPSAYVFNATTRVFTQVANMQWNVGGVNYSMFNGTSVRLADGRLFLLPQSLQHMSSASTFINNYSSAGGYYGVYDPVSGSFITGRLSGWEAAVAGGTLGTAGSGSTQGGVHGNLPIGQLPSGQLMLQELATSLSASRHFVIDFTMGYNAASISLGTFNWTASSWALAAHPQGLVAFNTGATTRRYFNATTGVMDAQNASVYSSASVGGSTSGFFYKALALGNGNYALPAANGSTEAYAYAFDGFTRIGTVRARKN